TTTGFGNRLHNGVEGARLRLGFARTVNREAAGGSEAARCVPCRRDRSMILKYARRPTPGNFLGVSRSENHGGEISDV
ncbi:MAG TPA: hypothetical protein VFQ65_17805, partial [Kofleriaceae bacterium]|nr:hypothetical protein [Kofleriaceae bacterium]